MNLYLGFFLVAVSCGESKIPEQDVKLNDTAPTPNFEPAFEINSSKNIIPEPAPSFETVPGQQTNEIELESPSPVASPPLSIITEDYVLEQSSKILNGFQEEILKNKLIVAGSVLNKVQSKLEKIQGAISNLLLDCPFSNNGLVMTFETCQQQSQKLVDREIGNFEALIELNKKYRIESNLFYKKLEVDVQKIQNGFKTVMRSENNVKNFPDPLKVSSNAVTPNSSDSSAWTFVTENFHKIKSSLELEKLIDKLKDESLNGNSKIFKLASLIKNTDEFTHLKSRFPIIVQRAIWAKKCQLNIKTLTNTEFRLFESRNQTVHTIKLSKSKNDVRPKYEVGQNWRFVPVNNANYFVLYNNYRTTILGASLKDNQGKIKVKKVDEFDLTMTLPNFQWKLQLNCQLKKNLNGHSSINESSRLASIVKEQLKKSTASSTESELLLSLSLPMEEVKRTTEMPREIWKTSDDEDCSDESLSLSLHSKEFPQLVLNVNENGKVVLDVGNPGRFFIEDKFFPRLRSNNQTVG